VVSVDERRSARWAAESLAGFGSLAPCLNRVVLSFVSRVRSSANVISSCCLVRVLPTAAFSAFCYEVVG
jgi:hypothetical protein